MMHGIGRLCSHSALQVEAILYAMCRRFFLELSVTVLPN